MDLGTSELHLESSFKCCPWSILTITWEIFPAINSALITTLYTIRHDSSAGSGPPGAQPLSSESSLSLQWLLDPSPHLMLGACVVLGCSISSYTHRQQEHDKFQTYIFALLLCCACGLGAGFGSSANLLMLGYIPWALCTGIAVSALVHWMLRKYQIRSSCQEPILNEKIGA